LIFAASAVADESYCEDPYVQCSDELVRPLSAVTRLTYSCSSACHASDNSPVYGVSHKCGTAFSHDSKSLGSKACVTKSCAKYVLHIWTSCTCDVITTALNGHSSWQYPLCLKSSLCPFCSRNLDTECFLS